MMGHGIAYATALSGIQVVVVDKNIEVFKKRLQKD